MPRLRFDKVVIQLMDRLKATLGGNVPDGMTVALTVTAPIRLAAKTAAALEEKIRALLGRRSPARDVSATIHGNRIRIRLLRHGSDRAPKLVGFVHNPDPAAAVLLLDLTSEWIQGPASSPAPNRRS